MGATYKRSKERPKRSMRNCLLQNAKRCQSTAYSFAVFDTAGGIIDEECLVEDLPEENLHELTKQEEYHEQE